MYQQILVFAREASAAAALLSGARALCARLVLVGSCSDSACADEIVHVPPEQSVAVLLLAIVSLIAERKPELVLCEQSADGKLVAAAAAVLLRTSPMCDASRLVCREDGVEAARIVYGGTAFETQRSPLPAVVVAAPGALPPTEGSGKGLAAELPPAPSPVELVEVQQLPQQKSVNLGAARTVVGVGRGISTPDNLPAVEQLAAAIGAEIGCTRPVAEEEHWYPKNRYLGVSGSVIKPRVYLALGISGQIQHMAGVNQAGTVFAVDKNEKAPIFRQADYGLVGDLKTVLPQLLERFK